MKKVNETLRKHCENVESIEITTTMKRCDVFPKAVVAHFLVAKGRPRALTRVVRERGEKK